MPNYAPFKSFFVTIDGNKVDISDFVSKMSYKREVEKENELKFTIEQSYIQLAATALKRGMTVEFQYGFKAGLKSVVHQARIVEIARSYNGTKVSMEVTARDVSSVIKKSFSDKVWSSVTTTDICKEIAVKYGLEFKGENSTYIWNNYPQSQKDDWAFLMEIVQQDESGNFSLYVDDGFLILERIGSDQASDLTFDFAKDSKIIKFAISEQEKKDSAIGSAGTSIVGFDPNEKQVVEKTASKGTLSENIDLGGKFGYEFSAGGEFNRKINENGGGFLSKALGISGVGSKVISGNPNADELSNEANSLTKTSQYEGIKGTLTINGTPSLRLNTVVTITGLPVSDDNGNFLIKCITDDVSTGGFITTLEMKKNATVSPNSSNDTANDDKSTVNTTVGGVVAETKKEIYAFDANGNRVLNKKTEFKVKQ